MLHKADTAEYRPRFSWLKWDSGGNATAGARNTCFDSLMCVDCFNRAGLASFGIVFEPLVAEEQLLVSRENECRKTFSAL